MINIIVKEKVISFSGLTTLLVQGEIYPEEIRFKFNTQGEHTSLSSITDWKIYYKSNKDDTIRFSTLTKEISQTDNTWSLIWNVESDTTTFKGITSLGIVGKTENSIWKTLPCAVKVAYGIEDINTSLEIGENL